MDKLFGISVGLLAGLLLVEFASTQEKKGKEEPRMQVSSNGGLLTNKEVQKELALSERLVAKIDALAEKQKKEERAAKWRSTKASVTAALRTWNALAAELKPEQSRSTENYWASPSRVSSRRFFSVVISL
jgi:hypothetical protein